VLPATPTALIDRYGHLHRNCILYNRFLTCKWIDSDAEQPRKRKLLRRHSSPAAASVADQTPDVSDASDSVPPVISSVLMVEVENVAHDPYKTTEEMKVFVRLVLLCACTSCHCLISRAAANELLTDKPSLGMAVV